MAEDDESTTNLKKLFSHRSITHQVDKIYKESNQQGRKKSNDSFTRIQASINQRKTVLPDRHAIKQLENFTIPADYQSITASTKTPSLSSGTSSFSLDSPKTTKNQSEVERRNKQLAYLPQTKGPIPKGLLSLVDTDHLFLYKSGSTMGMDMSTKTLDLVKYDVLNSEGKRIFVAQEVSAGRKCCRTFFGYPYTFALLNDTGVETLRCEGEPAACGSPPSVQIQNNKERFGVIHQSKTPKTFTSFLTIYTIGDAKGAPVFTIKDLGAGSKVKEFEVYVVNGDILIGRISKKWGNHAMGKFTSKDIFGISFTRAMDVRLKVLLLGLLIMMECDFFRKE